MLNILNGILVSKVSVDFHMTEKYGQYNEESNRAWDELVPGTTDNFLTTLGQANLCNK